MRLALLVLILCLFATGNEANAHPNSHPVNISVSTGWSWVPGHWTYIRVGTRHNTVHRNHKWIRGHWEHPRHGKVHRSHQAGPPIAHKRHSRHR